MSHRAQLLILALIAALVLLAILFPRPAASDAPVVSGAVPAGEFVPQKGGLNVDRVRPELVTPGATQPLETERGGYRLVTSQPARLTPSPSVRAVPSVAPIRVAARTRPASKTGISGVASWFASPRGVSAAGPALRTALGPGWRGMRVRVTGPAGSTWTTLGDWMKADRLIDLDDDVFPAVCGPLSRGICEAKVTW